MLISGSLTKNSEHSVRMYWSEISQEVNPFTAAKLETEPQAISEPEHKIREAPEKTDQPAEGRSNRTLVVRAGIAALCLLVIGAIAISSRIRATNEANAKFNAAYNAFLLERGKAQCHDQAGCYKPGIQGLNSQK